MNFRLLQLGLFFLIFYLPFVAVAKNTMQDYFNARVLSAHNIYLGVGIPLLDPPSSFKNSFSKHFLLQMDYRKEWKPWKQWTLPLVFKTEWAVTSKKLLESFSLFSGIRLPKNSRKTPFYFGLNIGTRWNVKQKKHSFYLQCVTSFRVMQLTRSISTLLNVHVNYPIDQIKWWQKPSIDLFTGMDVNL